MNASGPIAVVGATGHQGSATVDALLERGLAVRALTRRIDSDAATALAARGVEVVQADLSDPASIEAAFDGAAAAFGVTNFMGYGIEGEVAQGKVIGDAAKATGLPLLVFSSVGGADRNTGVPHFESKWRIEEYLRELELPLNVVRPVFFMDNLLELHMLGRDEHGPAVRLPLPEDVPLQTIASRDIGKVAAALIAEGELGAVPIEIAGDQTTGKDLTKLVGQLAGEPAHFIQMPLEAMGDDDDIIRMFTWFVEKAPAFEADFDRTRALVPDLEDLPTFLARQPKIA